MKIREKENKKRMCGAPIIMTKQGAELELQ